MSLPPPPVRPARPPRSVRRPLHRGIWIGLSVLILGVLAAGLWFFAAFPSVSDDLDRFHRASPQRPIEFTVEERVDWDVFIEPSTVTQSGFRFEILDANGDPVRLGRDHGFSYAWFGRSGRSIASVELQPGTYELRVVEGFSSVALGESPGAKMFRAIGGGLMIGLLVGGTGLVIIIVSVIKDTRRRNENREPPPPSPWSAGEWPSSEWPSGPGR